MTRRLLNFFTALSLLLCISVCVLWVRSYWVQDVLVFRKVYGQVHNPQRRFCDLFSSAGGVRATFGHRFDFYGIGTDAAARRMGHGKGWLVFHEVDRNNVTYPYLGGTGRIRPGFQLDRFCDPPHSAPGSPINTMDLYTIVLPHAVLAAALAVLPSVGLRRASARLRCPANQVCRSCGYDLRATPERCPECGQTR